MITVKIPAAVGESSPILWRISPPDFAPVPVAAVVVHVHGDGSLAVSARHGGVLFDDDSVSRDDVELIISRPTGAAHLAWWLLYSVRWTMTEHVERIEAMGWTLAGYQAAVDCAARGLPADLARLADYAHRVAGVTNG